MPKIIGRTTYSFDEQSFDFTIIELRETVTIGSRDALENTHRYWVPAGEDLADPTTYIEPITNPDYNLDADYQLYRQQYNFLSPTAIKAARQHLDLSVPTTALLLDMPEEVFLAIEMVTYCSHWNKRSICVSFSIPNNYLPAFGLIRTC